MIDHPQFNVRDAEFYLDHLYKSWGHRLPPVAIALSPLASVQLACERANELGGSIMDSYHAALGRSRESGARVDLCARIARDIGKKVYRGIIDQIGELSDTTFEAVLSGLDFQIVRPDKHSDTHIAAWAGKHFFCGQLYENIVIITPFPAYTWDSEGRLHSADGRPAIEFPDGWGVYYWRGEHVDADNEWIIEDPKSITTEKIAVEANVEVRRMMVDVMGIERIFREGEFIQLDYDEVRNVSLWASDNLWTGTVVVAHSICPSTGQHYFEFAPSDTLTVADWHRWAWQLDEEYNPIQEA